MYVVCGGGKVGDGVLGVERRRRWSDAAKLEILCEVNTNGRTLADVARHDRTTLPYHAGRRSRGHAKQTNWPPANVPQAYG